MDPTKDTVAAAIADVGADLPRGARRMTRVERKIHVQNVLDALQKQSGVRRRALPVVPAPRPHLGWAATACVLVLQIQEGGHTIAGVH
jgi:hypothetical protein